MTASAYIPGRQPLGEGDAAVLSHRSAALYHLRANPIAPSLASGAAAMRAADVPAQAARAELLKHPALEGGPLELLVREKSQCRHASDLVCHCQSADYPKGSFWQIDDRVVVASPELCFLQMASSLPLARLVELGTNLCGRYFINPATGKTDERTPVTSPPKLARYLSRASGIRGVRQAEHALKWILPDSRSPMETKTSILLHLPPRYGGFGFSDIVLNHSVHPGRHAHLVEQSRFEIDLCIVAKKVGVEYFGSEEHPDAMKDRRRLDALSALGWKVIVVDGRRLYDMDSFEVAARQFAKLAGRRLRFDDDWRARAAKLRGDIGLDGFSHLAPRP